VTGSWDQTARLWDLETGRCLQTFAGHTGDVRAVAVTPDGRRLVTGSGDHTARLWDLATGRCLQTFAGHTSDVRAVAVTPDGRRLVTGSWDHTVKFWDVETGELLATLHHLREGFLWTTPPTQNAPSGWLWTDKEDLVSVVRCLKADGSDLEALANDDPERRRYLSVYNREEKVMLRLKLSGEEIKRIEDELSGRIRALERGQTPRERPPQLGPGRAKRDG